MKDRKQKNRNKANENRVDNNSIKSKRQHKYEFSRFSDGGFGIKRKFNPLTSEID